MGPLGGATGHLKGYISFPSGIHQCLGDAAVSPIFSLFAALFVRLKQLKTGGVAKSALVYLSDLDLLLLYLAVCLGLFVFPCPKCKSVCLVSSAGDNGCLPARPAPAQLGGLHGSVPTDTPHSHHAGGDGGGYLGTFTRA